MEPVSSQAMPAGMRVGFDLVQISRLAESVRSFGRAFTDRLFTPDELAYAQQGCDMSSQRLAARFAAKEALIKALRLSEAGVNWREIEVLKLPDGDCSLVLHGHVAALARQMGLSGLWLSLSHDGDYAGAFVTALLPESRTLN